MRLGRNGAIVLGALTVLPFVWMAVSFVSIASVLFSSLAAAESGSYTGAPTSGLFLLIAGHLAMMLLIVSLMTFYVAHLFKTSNVADDKKALWAVVMFLGNIFAMPVYWYLYVWRPLQPAGRPGSPRPAAG